MDPFADAVAERLASRGGAGGSGGTVVYQIGDVTLSVEALKDIVTLQEFVDLLLAAKRSNPVRSRG